MNRLTAVIIVIILMMASVFVAERDLDSATDKLEADIAVCEELFNSRKYEDCTAKITQTQKQWENRYDRLSLFVDNEKLDEMSTQLATMRVAARKRVAADFLISAETIKILIDRLSKEFEFRI